MSAETPDHDARTLHRAYANALAFALATATEKQMSDLLAWAYDFDGPLGVATWKGIHEEFDFRAAALRRRVDAAAKAARVDALGALVERGPGSQLTTGLPEDRQAA